MSCVCTTQLVLLALTVLQYAICCWLCQKSENYSYEWLEKLYRIVCYEFMFQSPAQERYSYQVCNSMYECDPSVVMLYDSDFLALSQNCEKQQFWCWNLMPEAICSRLELKFGAALVHP